MCLGGSKPSVPDATPVPAPAQSADTAMQSARDNQAKKAAAAGGANSTIATSGLGDTSSAMTQKSKLGA